MTESDDEEAYVFNPKTAPNHDKKMDLLPFDAHMNFFPVNTVHNEI